MKHPIVWSAGLALVGGLGAAFADGPADNIPEKVRPVPPPGIQVPDADQQDALFQSVAGNEEHQRPKFYAPFESALPEITRHARTIESLTAKFPQSKPLFDAAMQKIEVPAERVRWLPVHHRLGFWTALVDIQDGKPIEWVAFDPYGP